ncbi:MAG: CoA-binding protein [Candidatus Methanofastidiosa archaeon]|nr:CoA-binding protein [Candidatus Methanofastidiosa archaeon]
MVETDTRYLDDIFNPRSIALIGATNNKKKVGYDLVKNLRNYNGNLYLINIREQEIDGTKAFRSILDVEDEVDLAIISIPSHGVEDALEECGRKGVKGVVIISAGFSEIGNVESENRINDISKRFGMRLIGPNSIGMTNNLTGLNATFTMNSKHGHIAFISQSGALGAAIIYKTVYEDIGFSKFISIGNMVDVDFCSLLKYLSHDKDTKSIALYMEGLEDGKKFISVAKECSMKKPIIALKSGRSKAGARATSSHTGSLAGSDSIYDAAFRQAGILRADTIDDLLDSAKVFNQPMLRKNRVAILTNAGGPGILATDECEAQGLKIPELNDGTKASLKRILSPYASVNNPIDTIAQADYNQYYSSIKILEEDEDIDAILSIIVVPTYAKIGMNTHAKAIVDAWSRKKPIVTCFMSGEVATSSIRYMLINKIPSYPSPERAASALGSLWKYSEWYNARNG